MNAYISVDGVSNGGTMNGKPSPDGRSWIRINHVHFDGEAPWTSLPDGSVVRKVITRQALDKTAPFLFELAAAGRLLKRVQLEITDAVGGAARTVAKMTLKDVTIESVTTSNGTGKPLLEVKYIYVTTTVEGSTTYWLRGW